MVCNFLKAENGGATFRGDTTFRSILVLKDERQKIYTLMLITAIAYYVTLILFCAFFIGYSKKLKALEAETRKKMIKK